MIRVGSVSQWAKLEHFICIDNGNVQLHVLSPSGAVVTFSAGDDIVEVPVVGCDVIEFAAVPGLEVSCTGLCYFRDDFQFGLQSRDLKLLLRFEPEALGRLLSPAELAERRRQRDARLAGRRAEDLASETAQLRDQLALFANELASLRVASAAPAAPAAPAVDADAGGDT